MSDPLARLRERRLKAIVARLPTTRTCAACDLCCIAVGVEEIDKPAAVACPHLSGEAGCSCAIYPKRPPSCRDFFCAWRCSDVILPPQARPADAGWVMAINDPGTFPHVVTIHPDPARPDAWNAPWARRLFAAIADHWNAVVVVGQGALATHIFAPTGHVFDKPTSPALFVEDGAKVGVPAFMFHRDPKNRTLPYRGGRIDFTEYWP